MMAISFVDDSQQKSTMAVSLTGALSVLQANNIVTYRKSSATTQQQLQSASSVNTHTFPGNEQADTLAKQGGQTEQPGSNVSYQENTTITKVLMILSQEKCAYHLLSRPEQVIMVRLSTKYNRWCAHMHTKLKKLNMVPSDACLFGEED